MEKKKEPIDKAIYIAFLIIMALLFCDITVFFQKCYWHHDDSIVLETTSTSIMIGIIEGIILFDLLKYRKPRILPTKFDTTAFCIALLFALLHFTGTPENSYDIYFSIVLILFFVVIIHRGLIPILPSFKNRH